jgi:hypothetical protein
MGALDVLRYFGDYTCPLKRVRLQWKIRPIKIQHVEQNVGKNKNGADEVGRSPESRAMIGSKIGQHLTIKI